MCPPPSRHMCIVGAVARRGCCPRDNAVAAVLSYCSCHCLIKCIVCRVIFSQKFATWSYSVTRKSRAATLLALSQVQQPQLSQRWSASCSMQRENLGVTVERCYYREMQHLCMMQHAGFGCTTNQSYDKTAATQKIQILGQEAASRLEK